MSDNTVVVLIGAVAFAAGVGIAVRLWPPTGGGRIGELVWWASRLVAGVALASLALNVYSAVKYQSGDSELGAEYDAIYLADGLARGVYEAGVLAALSVGLALVGTLIVTRAGDD